MNRNLIIVILIIIFVLPIPAILGEAVDEAYTGVLRKSAYDEFVRDLRGDDIWLSDFGTLRDVAELDRSAIQATVGKIPANYRNTVLSVSTDIRGADMGRILWLLMIAAVLSVAVAIFVRMKPVVKRAKRADIGEDEGLVAYISQIYAGHFEVKLFNMQEYAKGKMQALNRGAYEDAWKGLHSADMVKVLAGIFSNIAALVVIVLGGCLAATGSIKIGVIFAFILYIFLIKTCYLFYRVVE